MIIRHLTGSIEPDSGGPAYSIPMLCETLRDQGHIVDLLTLRGSNEHLVTTQHRSFPVWKFSGKLGHAPEMWRWLKQSIKTSRPDILHSHNLWALPSIYPAIVGARYEIPHIVSPRGTLTRYSMSTGSRIKRVYWPFVQRPVLQRVAAFHATAEAELDDIRRLGFRQPVAVIPNGIEIHPVPSLATGIDPSKTILYFGRFHPEKGLADLLLAWEIASSKRPDWSLLLVGPDNVGYRAELEKLVADRRIQGVTFEGPQYGSDKLGVYRRGSVYVLPSPTENFGMTVAEALSMEVPVIANRGAPWAGLELNQCGWWIEHGTSPLAAALIQVMQTTPAELQAMGARGRVWMNAEYSWAEIGKHMQSFYLFMLGKETKPEFVYLK
jgi:glycosyltransferase involved in cell wall biosynthesis